MFNRARIANQRQSVKTIEYKTFKRALSDCQAVRVAGRELTKYTIALLFIVLVGAFLKLYHIGAQSLSADDTWSVWVSKLRFAPNCEIARS